MIVTVDEVAGFTLGLICPVGRRVGLVELGNPNALGVVLVRDAGGSARRLLREHLTHSALEIVGVARDHVLGAGRFGGVRPLGCAGELGVVELVGGGAVESLVVVVVDKLFDKPVVGVEFAGEDLVGSNEVVDLAADAVAGEVVEEGLGAVELGSVEVVDFFGSQTAEGVVGPVVGGCVGFRRAVGVAVEPEGLGG